MKKNNKEELKKEATGFEENYTVYEVAKRKDGSDYAKKVCKVTVKEAYLAGAEPREKRITELEKENAELKTDYKVLSCSVDNFGKLQDELEEEQRKNNGLSDNLAKAKEIIRDLLSCLYSVEYDCISDLEEAEQFIKDSEVDE